MCGLLAMIARKPVGFLNRDLDVFQSMLLLDGWYRGMDSTGVFQVLRNRQVAYAKQASHALNLFASPAWPDMKRRMISDGRVMVGHNRKATQGSINSKNAHPFHENNIILVHNGTLFGHRALADVDVDSQAIAQTIDKEGVEATIKKLHGAFALIWYDLQKERLFAIRNKDRPLIMTVTDHCLYLNSEAWMANVSMSRNGTDLKDIKETITLEPGLLYEFTLEGTYTTKQLELRPEVVHRSTYMGPGWSASEDGLYNDCGYDDRSNKGYPNTGSKPNHNTKPATTALTIVENNKENMGDTFAKMFPAAQHYFDIGDTIMIRINSVKAGIGKNAKTTFQGNTLQPGCPLIDICGTLPDGTDPSEIPHWYKGPVIAKVSYFSYTSCGATIHVSDVRFDTILETQNGTIGETEWEYVESTCTCSKCNHWLFSEDVNFTSITRKSTHKDAEYRITCADCVEATLPEGNIKDEFVERRYAALSNGKPVSKESSSDVKSKAGKESTTTVH